MRGDSNEAGYSHGASARDGDASEIGNFGQTPESYFTLV